MLCRFSIVDSGEYPLATSIGWYHACYTICSIAFNHDQLSIALWFCELAEVNLGTPMLCCVIRLYVVCMLACSFILDDFLILGPIVAGYYFSKSKDICVHKIRVQQTPSLKRFRLLIALSHSIIKNL